MLQIPFNRKLPFITPFHALRLDFCRKSRAFFHFFEACFLYFSGHESGWLASPQPGLEQQLQPEHSAQPSQGHRGILLLRVITAHQHHQQQKRHSLKRHPSHPPPPPLPERSSYSAHEMRNLSHEKDVILMTERLYVQQGKTFKHIRGGGEGAVVVFK